MKHVSQVYISIDIETDGPVPGLYSMLSLGAVALQRQGEKGWVRLGDFYEKLTTLKEEGYAGAKLVPHEGTMRFWEKFPEAYKEATTGSNPITDVIRRFNEWTKTMSFFGRVTTVAGPAVFDGGFVHWYMLYALGHDGVLGHRGLDMKSLSMGFLKQDYLQSGKEYYPREWRNDSFKHDHTAINDAAEQAYLFTRVYDRVMFGLD